MGLDPPATGATGDVRGLRSSCGADVGASGWHHLVSVSALANFAFIPYYPFWAIIVITLDVLVLWALAVHGRDIKEYTQ